MSNIQIFIEEFQTSNKIPNFSEKSANKNNNQIPKSKNESPVNFDKVLFKLIKRFPYPNFRFFCPYCSSLDVFITIEKSSKHLIIDCLECKKNWVDLRYSKI